jgi:hypothetical protein
MVNNTVQTDLLLAILSLDAYNRNYNKGIDGLTTGSNSRVGDAFLAEVDLTEEFTEAGKAASFYAQAYRIDGVNSGGLDGTTVISYRGTDEEGKELASVDIPISFQNSYDQDQLRMALQYFTAVKNDRDHPELRPGLGEREIILTGHSLGGALA